jgi:hypothetical protein
MDFAKGINMKYEKKSLQVFLELTDRKTGFFINVPHRSDLIAKVDYVTDIDTETIIYESNSFNHLLKISYFKFTFMDSQILLLTERQTLPEFTVRSFKNASGLSVFNHRGSEIFEISGEGKKELVPTIVPIRTLKDDRPIITEEELGLCGTSDNYILDFHFGRMAFTLQFKYHKKILEGIRKTVPANGLQYDIATCSWLIDFRYSDLIPEVINSIDQHWTDP